MFLIVLGIMCVMKYCNYERYKLQNQFNTLPRGDDQKMLNGTASNGDNYSRSDYIITYLFALNSQTLTLPFYNRASEKTAGSHSDCSNLDVRFGARGKAKMDSDSGRGESESETHSRNVKLSNVSRK